MWASAIFSRIACLSYFLCSPIFVITYELAFLLLYSSQPKLHQFPPPLLCPVEAPASVLFCLPSFNAIQSRAEYLERIWPGIFGSLKYCRGGFASLRDPDSEQISENLTHNRDLKTSCRVWIQTHSLQNGSTWTCTLSNVISIFSILVLPQSAKSTQSSVHSQKWVLIWPHQCDPLMIWIIDVLVDSIQLWINPLPGFKGSFLL